MTAKDGSQSRAAGTGTVYIAAYGTALPSAWDSALPSTYWTDLGYTDEDGVTFTDEPTIEQKRAWQARLPVRAIETARAVKAAGKLLQWNAETVRAVAGGGTITAAGSGAKFSPHATGELGEWSVVIDRVDGSITDRFVIERCVTTSAFEAASQRTDTSDMAFEFEALEVDGDEPWYMLTSDSTAFPADS